MKKTPKNLTLCEVFARDTAAAASGDAPRVSVLDLLAKLSVADRKRYVGYIIIKGKIELLLT